MLDRVQVGWSLGRVGWASAAGYAEGKFPFFFLFYFSVLNSNSNLLFYFAGFELDIHLQDFEFDITYQI
jgi:hypothetical protein